VQGKYRNFPLAKSTRMCSCELMISPAPAIPLPECLDELAAIDENKFENECFSRRLITGAAAEGFFE